MGSLKDKVVFITGGSRGIGEAIALRCAKDGARVVIAAKTADPHPTLPGTIHSVAKAIEALGGTALPIQLDVRDEQQIQNAITQTVDTFGQLDVLINNASCLNLTPTLDTPMKKFDLMFDVNVRGAFACSQAAIPHLANAQNPHILNLAPPLNMKPEWFEQHVAYTMSKYGMSMCTLGMAEELKSAGIAVNSLWPKTTIATSAIKVYMPPLYAISRKPSIVADAAYHIMTHNSREITGNFFIDEDVLRETGIDDFSAYAMDPNTPAPVDIFVDPS